MKDLVSIIIPAYNVENYIFRGIESCINQTYKDIEIIIIDDGSSDNTQNIIKEYAQKDSRIKYLFQENKGVSAARNTGLDISKGDYVIFLDSDDWLELNTVEYLLNKKKEYKDYFITTNFKTIYLENEKIKIEKEIEEVLELLSSKKISSTFISTKYRVKSSCYKLFSKEILDANKIRFKENIYHGEDGLFVFEYLLHVENVLYTTKQLWNILERPNSASRGKFNKKFFTVITAVEEMIKLAKNDKNLEKELKKYLYCRTKYIYFCGIKDNALNKNEEKILKSQIKNLEKLYLKDQRKLKKLKSYIAIRLPKTLLKVLLNIKN